MSTLSSPSLPPVPAPQRLRYLLSPGADVVARIGVLALPTDHTLEREWRSLLQVPGVDFYTARLPSAASGDAAGLASLRVHVGACAQRLSPDTPLDVLAFACTTATVAMGESAALATLREARPEAAPTTPLSAACAALRALAVRRVALITPYSDDFNARETQALTDAGFTVASLATFGEVSDAMAARIHPESLRDAARRAVRGGRVDAVFFSCTSLPVARLIPALEVELGVPVISSNQAMAWHALWLARAGRISSDQGKLWTSIPNAAICV